MGKFTTALASQAQLAPAQALGPKALPVYRGKCQQHRAPVVGIIAAMIPASSGPLRATCLAAAAVGWALAACSPALNWRSVSLPEAGLVLTLPCKPDHAVRPVDLGADAVQLSMTGCEADGATFAVSHMPLADAGQAGVALARWQAAVHAGMRASTVSDATAFVPARALALPQAVRRAAQGHGPDGAVVLADAVWFARLEGGRARLYHAVVYAPRPPGAAADTFFASLELQP